MIQRNIENFQHTVSLIVYDTAPPVLSVPKETAASIEKVNTRSALKAQ